MKLIKNSFYLKKIFLCFFLPYLFLQGKCKKDSMVTIKVAVRFANPATNRGYSGCVHPMSLYGLPPNIAGGTKTSNTSGFGIIADGNGNLYKSSDWCTFKTICNFPNKNTWHGTFKIVYKNSSTTVNKSFTQLVSSDLMGTYLLLPVPNDGTSASVTIQLAEPCRDAVNKSEFISGKTECKSETNLCRTEWSISKDLTNKDDKIELNLDGKLIGCETCK